MKLKSLVWLAVALQLTACNGGGSGDSGTSATETSSSGTLTGVVLDSAIAGLTYTSYSSDRSSLVQGITSATGEFKYFKGGETEFRAGYVIIGTAVSGSIVAINDLFSDDTEKANVSRFLLTLDDDDNPDNGIQITEQVRHNLTSDESFHNLQFDNSFDTDFSDMKDVVFQNTGRSPITVSAEMALEHSSKSELLTVFKNKSFYKAIAGELNYNIDSYNTELLEQSQRRRLYLWLWQNVTRPQFYHRMEMELDSPDYSLENIENMHDNIDKWIEYGQTIVDVASVSKGAVSALKDTSMFRTPKQVRAALNLGDEACTLSMELEDGTPVDDSVGSSLCSTLSKYQAVDDFVSNAPFQLIMGSLNIVLNKIDAGNGVEFKLDVSPPSYGDMAIKLAQFANDSYGAYEASVTNEKLLNMQVAMSWLNLNYQAGMDQKKVNEYIFGEYTDEYSNADTIKALVLKYGSASLLCDTIHFFNRQHKCDDLNDISYNVDEINHLFNESLHKTSVAYNMIVSEIGPLSDGTEISSGTIVIDPVTSDDQDDENHGPIDGSGYVQGIVKFVDESDEVITVPSDAWIRLVPKAAVDYEYDIWDGVLCKLHASAQNKGLSTYGDSECYSYLTREELDTYFTSDSEEFQVVIFKNSYDEGNVHWSCDEDAYLYAGDSESNITHPAIYTVLPWGYIDNSSMSCD